MPVLRYILCNYCSSLTALLNAVYLVVATVQLCSSNLLDTMEDDKTNVRVKGFSKNTSHGLWLF